MYQLSIIKPSGEVELLTQPKAPTLNQMQSIVGGYIERVPCFNKFMTQTQGMAFANEAGIPKGLHFNPRASNAWKEQFKFATPLYGTILFYAKVKVPSDA